MCARDATCRRIKRQGLYWLAATFSLKNPLWMLSTVTDLMWVNRAQAHTPINHLRFYFAVNVYVCKSGVQYSMT